MSSTDASAHLDPWLLFCAQNTDSDSPRALFLFGYALHHHRLLGLSWIRSTPVRRLRHDARSAVTASGSRYALGRRAEALGELGPEGRVAWNCLVHGTGTRLERRWLGACKAARWLNVPQPALGEDAVSAFEAEQVPRYLAWRAGLAGRQGSA